MAAVTLKWSIISCFPFFLAEDKGDEPRREIFFSKPILVIAPNREIASQLERAITISPDGPNENFLLKTGIVPADFAVSRSVVPSG